MAGSVDERPQIHDRCEYEIDEEPAMHYDEEDTVGDLALYVHDLPADIRLKIDDIIRNHNGDLRSQMDAIDALLYGK